MNRNEWKLEYRTCRMMWKPFLNYQQVSIAQASKVVGLIQDNFSSSYYAMFDSNGYHVVPITGLPLDEARWAMKRNSKIFNRR